MAWCRLILFVHPAPPSESSRKRSLFEQPSSRVGLASTGNPLDVAIQNNGFFEVKTADGVRYTRNGIFSLDNQRRLVTNLGHPVMGIKGEIKSASGNIQINAEGGIQVDGNPIGAIKVVEFSR